MTRVSAASRIPLEAIGGVIWLLACLLLVPPLEVGILLFAALVVVPLGLRLIEREGESGLERSFHRLIATITLPCAMLLATSFAVPARGLIAAALATPWLAVTLLLAALGALRIWRTHFALTSQAGFAAGLLFIAVGGGWTVISRAGVRPQEFSDAIVLLTGVHFHYAGFALPILASAAVRQLPQQPRLNGVMLAGIILGVPLVGVGISLSPLVEVVASILLVAACLLLAASQIRLAIHLRQPNASSLLVISSLTLLTAMIFAAVYAVGEFTGQKWIDIPAMIPLHGATNAFGFALCGLLAHYAATAKTAQA